MLTLSVLVLMSLELYMCQAMEIWTGNLRIYRPCNMILSNDNVPGHAGMLQSMNMSFLATILRMFSNGQGPV